MGLGRAPHILVADDERSIRLMLETGLSLNGFRVTCARTGREALEAARSHDPDAVLSDIYMPDGGGFELMEQLRAARPALPVVLMTAQGSVEAAVEAMARGATDFIGKPFEIASVVALIRQCLEARLEPESAGPEEAEAHRSRSGLVGRSAAMAAVYKLIALAARTDATVLVLGESGTGKELVARAIHDFSPRAAGPFVAVNCSGLTDTLLEAELFGHARGAFTGAVGERGGLFESADNGTLFLDELGSTSPAFQASLLRVLQSGEARRVGSVSTRKVNARVIGASNAPLSGLVADGRFRADLYYRLGVIRIELPPLGAREGDVELLAAHFLRQFQAPGGPALRLTREAAAAVRAYPFPGNVREMENALRRAAALSSGGVITVDCLPPEIACGAAGSRQDREAAGRGLVADRPTMAELERRYLELVLAESGWNRRRAAAVLGVDRRTIQRLMTRHRVHAARLPIQ